MIDAQLLATLSSSEGEPTIPEVWGVWVPRKGDNARFVLEVCANFGMLFTATIYAKDYADVGDGSDTGKVFTFASGVTGRQILEYTGSKELVRFKFTMERSDTLGEDEIGWVLFRFLQPTWFEAVR
jgi:hypothetical protein